MDMFVIQGGTPLDGTVHVEGAKNAALPIMAASLAVTGDIRLTSVPELVDVATMSLLLTTLGATVIRAADGMTLINSSGANKVLADYELVRRMRASICVLGPLLARFGKATVSLPGGCNIGHRPIDLHLKGLSALGADVKIENGYVLASCHQLRGNDIDLGGPCGSSVTGTCNVMTAASMAVGRTVIRCAAREPEVVDLGTFLNAAGAQIDGLGTSTIEIQGVEELRGCSHTVMPDRIEAATFAIAAAATRGKVLIPNAPVQTLKSVIDVLHRMGVQINSTEAGMLVSCENLLRPADVKATPYPGIPTDTQAQLMALLATIPGTSTVSDTVFSDRFMHASELMRMGAVLRRGEAGMVVDGGRPLSGANVMASDLRASAALVIAGLAARGQTTVRRIYHLDRGYAALETKLSQLGASVQRRRDSSAMGNLPAPHFHNAVATDGVSR